MDGTQIIVQNSEEYRQLLNEMLLYEDLMRTVQVDTTSDGAYAAAMLAFIRGMGPDGPCGVCFAVLLHTGPCRP